MPITGLVFVQQALADDAGINGGVTVSNLFNEMPHRRCFIQL